MYLGTLPDRVTLSRLIGRACRQAGVEARTDLPPGVEAVRRGEFLFLISHLDRPVEIDLGAKHHDLLTWTMVGPQAVLAPRDALVLARGAGEVGERPAAGRPLPGPARGRQGRGAPRYGSIHRSGNSAPCSACGRGPKMRRSASWIRTSLMLASRRRIRPRVSNSHNSLP